MSDTLPVREMVLYKHGVGFFVRGGEVEGQNLALTFRHDEINDVLKSLAVFDRAGGQVLGVHYQTPMDKAVRLSYTSIRLSDHASLRDLLRDLRGRRVTVEIETTLGSMERLTGRMIGLDQHVPESSWPENDPAEFARVTLLLESGAIRTFSYLALHGLTIHDSQSGHDLTYFLDTSMDEDSLRTVNVRLSEGQHDLAVYYVAPSPTWRVSYRLVADADEDGSGTGKALLQGWGLFDNRLEEDLNDVRVTLVAGQPISFIYDLYASRIPERPVVEDEARVAPKPPEFQAARHKYAPEEKARRGAGATEAYAVMRPAMADRVAMASMEMADFDEAEPAGYLMMDKLMSVEPGAEGKETGETFQYIVTTPVTVKRGESALVPIIGNEIRYSRELLYNGQKFPKHPVAALRFENNTGLTLERGPVTVVEDGDYKGEAIIPFTKDTTEVYVPFAVELGVKVVETENLSTQMLGLKIERALLVFEQYSIETMHYKLENSTPRDLTVTIEAGINEKVELFDTVAPSAQTLTERRWQIEVKAHDQTEFVRKQRRVIYHHEEIRRLSYARLHQLFQQNVLSDVLHTKLTELIDTLGSIQKAEQRHVRLKAEREVLYKQQEQLRANLGALHTAGKEAVLRERLLGQLETAQDKIDAIDREIEELGRQIEAANARIDEIIAGLSQN